MALGQLDVFPLLMFKHAQCQLAGLHVAQAKDATNTFINIHLFVARSIPVPALAAAASKQDVTPPSPPPLSAPDSPFFSTDVWINNSVASPDATSWAF